MSGDAWGPGDAHALLAEIGRATPSARKCESDGGPTAAQIQKLLGNGKSGVNDQTKFALAQLAFWLLAAIDGHAKNFSIFLIPGGRYEATPLYDVLSAWPIEGHGPNLLHRRELTLAIVVHPADFPGDVWDKITGGLRSQQARYMQARAARP